MRALVISVAGVLLLAGCASAPDPAPTTTSTTAVTNATSAPTKSTTFTTKIRTAPRSSTTTKTTTALNWPTSEVEVEHDLRIPPVPTLKSIRTGIHPGFERITFTFDTDIPGYRVKYVKEARQDGSGFLVGVPGNYLLEVRFEPTVAHDENGPTIPRQQFVWLNQINAYVLTGDFEANTTVVVGLKSKTGFKVRELKDPNRVYIDIAR